jgi:hypothetical protein
MRGRRPIGPELADRMDGSARAQTRMRLILETLAGKTPVKDAREQLGICTQRFEALRAEAIRAGIAALEPKPLGRPARANRTPEVARLEARVSELEARVAELEAELQAADVRAELAGQLPKRDRAAKKAPPRSNRAKESHRARPGHSKPTN